MNTCLSIAGSDPSGGAGIQADLKTMTVNGVYAMCAITALTVQNTLGVTNILEVEPAFLGQQIDAVFQDLRPDAVKVGMVSSARLIRVIAQKLRQHGAQNVVVDPVMVATSGSRLLGKRRRHRPAGGAVPPGYRGDAQHPRGPGAVRVGDFAPVDMERAAQRIGDAYGCAVLCKGGHSLNDANDYLYRQGQGRWFPGRRIQNPNTHGTGCTLSSAIAANLAKGQDLETAVATAKEYLSGALATMLDLGHGSGPLDHAYSLRTHKED